MWALHAGTLNGQVRWKSGTSAVFAPWGVSQPTSCFRTLRNRRGLAFCFFNGDSCSVRRQAFFVLSTIQLFCGHITPLDAMAEQGNRVRTPDGTAPVCAESVFVMKIGHWGILRRLNTGVETSSGCASQKTYKKGKSPRRAVPVCGLFSHRNSAVVIGLPRPFLLLKIGRGKQGNWRK